VDEVRYARNGDVRIAYEVFGDPAGGEPVLLVMGLDFQMLWWHEDLCALLVDRGFSVVRFDNRDTGLSTRFAPAGPQTWKSQAGLGEQAYTTLDMVADTLAVMDAVGWRSAHLVGGSMGGAVAQAVTVLHGDRVRSLTSAMALPLGLGPLRTLRYVKPGLFPRFAKLPKVESREQEIENLVTVYRAIASPGFPFDEAWVRRTAGRCADRGFRDPLTNQRQMAAGRGVHYPPLSTVRVPTLVLSGADDPLIRSAGGRDTARRIPGAKLRIEPGMGHDLPRPLWPALADDLEAMAKA
jgi:pimeloyl-ACP methyl ester carboxylesterase